MDDGVREKFLQLYRKLIIQELRVRLGLPVTDSAVTLVDAGYLLQIASILSCEKHPLLETGLENVQGWAYDVATRVAEAFGEANPGIARAAEFILSRLGNFPGRELLRSTFSLANEVVRLNAPCLTLETLVHEAENTVEYPVVGPKLLTDFQIRLSESLNRSRAVSVSAPTSAGKSFVFAHDILKTVSERPGNVLVYLVPTRALIQQVTNDLLSLLRDAGKPDLIVSAAPIAFTSEQAAQGLVYVLTQERLSSLLSDPAFNLNVVKIYVDEAQEIGDQDRGLILDAAIREMVRRFPSVRICFASPLTKNPGYLFDEFDLAREGEFFTETVSPVSQVLVNLDPVKGKPRAADVSVITPTGVASVGQVQLSFKFSGVWDRLAQTAIYVTKPDESAIVYANRPGDAMEIADKLAEQIPLATVDPDVLSLIDFVKAHVHSRYALADTLLKGVAFHYGRMPHIIRNQVETLLRAKKLRFVASTSTLLQGVNLPARHIVVHAPKQGNKSPMHTTDFWNLVGRAGRLRENFRGMVWCIDPSKWETKPFDGERLTEIRSAFHEIVEDNMVRAAAIEVLDGTAPLFMVQERGRVEQFLGKAFCEFTLRGQKLSESPRVPLDFRTGLIPVENRLIELRKRLSVPEAVCLRNAVISPTLLEELWVYFSKNLHFPLIPIDPYRAGALGHFRSIFEVIAKVFIGVDNKSWQYYSTLAFHWVKGSSLKDLIDNRIKYYKVSSDRKPVNATIRELLDDIELTLRFTYVKYLRAYIDVLSAFLEQLGFNDIAEALSPWDLYVEFGARDKVLLMLMSIGVSRSTSILIRRAITSDNDVGREECWSKLCSLPLNVLNVPEVCRREIRQLTGNSK